MTKLTMDISTVQLTSLMVLNTTFVVLLALGNCNGVTYSSCPGGWDHYGRTCYDIKRIAKTWTGAREHCRGMFGDLAILATRTEQNWMSAKVEYHCWIGLRRREGRWVWVDGTYLSSGIWAEKQPDFAITKEYCVQYFPEGRWNDYYCSRNRDGFICGRPVCQTVSNCDSYKPCVEDKNPRYDRCARCEYDRGGDKKAYELSTNGMECKELCSWRRIYCYPGRCTDGTPSTCTCAPSFGGHNCRTVTDPPTMHYCLGKLKRMVNGTERDTVEAPCTDDTTSPTVWTNVRFDSFNQLQFEAEWETSFQEPNATVWPRHYYIHEHKIGVISASVDWYLERGRGRLFSGTIQCLDGSISRDNPATSMHNCTKNEMIPATPQHGDSVYFTTKSRNGGFIRIKNFDGRYGFTVNSPVYFSGREVAHTAHFTFDFQRPYHCSVADGCTDNMLDRGPPFTKNGNINLRWSGWRDDGAGIGEYEYEVFLLVPFGGELQQKFPTFTGGKVSSDITEVEVSINQTGVYSIVLTVEDSCGPNDGNFITARRFLIFDNNSTVEVDTSGHFPMWVDSLASNATWQTNLQDSRGDGPKVVVKWPGHFYNHLHRHNKFLNAIKEHHPPITAGYEEPAGQPPVTRSREAIPNVHGVVMFQTDWAVDHHGGRTLVVPPGNWQDVTNIMGGVHSLR